MGDRLKLWRLPAADEPLVHPAASDDMLIFMHCSMDGSSAVTEGVFRRMVWPLLQRHGFDGFDIEDLREDDNACYCK